MRRKLAALLCALALVAGIYAPVASAAGTVYFTAVNDAVLELSDATMPFWTNGYLYVAGTLFNAKSLDTGFIYNPVKGMAVAYSRNTTDYALFFDLNRNAVDDNEGYGYYPPAVVRNGVAFVPVSLVCEYFNLTWSSTKVPNGYLVRVCNSGASLSDKSFADAASYNMVVVYQQYLAAREPAVTPEPPLTETSEDPVPSAEGLEIVLCFRPESRESLVSVLDVLDARGAAGTFYLTAEELAAWGDPVRRMVSTGHSVGLLSSGQADVAEQLFAANDALWRAAETKTRLCLLEDGTEEARAAAEAAGYRVLEAAIGRDGLSGAAAAEALFQEITARRSGVCVLLSGRMTANGVRELLRLAEDAGCRFTGLRETWSPGT